MAVSNPVGSLQEEVAVVTGATVLNASTSALGFEPEIDVTAAEVASLLTITAKADDAQRAADAANTVAATYVQAQLGAAANVAQPAVPPADPSGLGPLVYAVLGSILGAIAGAIVSYLQGIGGPKPVKERPPPTLPDNRDLRIQPVMAEPVMAEPVTTEPVMAEPVTAEPVTAAPVMTQTEITEAAATPQAASAAASSFSAMVSEARAPEPAPEPWIEEGATDDIWSDGDHPAADEQKQLDDYEQPEATDPQVFDHLQPSGELQPIEELQALDSLEDLERRALLSQFEAARYELVLTHNEELARADATHERLVADLRGEIAHLNKQVRMQEARLKNRSGTDQNRVGDLEAQTDALEAELATLRQGLESERIAHSKQLTEERGTADRALDNARRQYREELSKHVHTHRQALADHRADLDDELAQDRTKHAAALEAQHVEYEQQLENERRRLDAKVKSALDRQQKELVDTNAHHRQELTQQALQHKETIAALRLATDESDLQLRELEKANRALRVELSTLQKSAQQTETENGALMQRLSDEIALMRGELEGERERNSALRADVLRRSAEAHQAIDRAVEERTSQLAELEASVARQREYADRRVRESSAAAEEQARQASMREADLTATISRLKRELAEATKPT